MKKFLFLSFCFLSACLLFGGGTSAFAQESARVILIHPAESLEAFGNPMKGFRVSTGNGSFRHEYATISQCYIKWSELENDESDTIEKIRAFCDAKWKSCAEHGIKVIPRVYLDWDRNEGNEYWPKDLQTGDYSSEAFQKRVVRLIERLGECWDQDPRVAWIQMGLIGFWGEQHSPSPTPEMQKLLGDAFTRAFPHKKVVVRHADEFLDYEFGIYWDSWAHLQQMDAPRHGAGIVTLNQTRKRWLIAPIEGETAYNWGKYQIQPGDSPNDTLSDPVHREFLMDSIRRLHCSGLGWIANYDPSVPAVQEGAAEVQKIFGYRFVLKSFEIPARLEPGQHVSLKFDVKNVGSAPFYENWPVEFSLLDPETKKPVWKTTLENVDVRKWLPGDDWDDEKNEYRIAAETYCEAVSIPVPATLPAGKYIAALAILEPFSCQPSVRFAISNYFRNGRHPLCFVGVGQDLEGDGTLDPQTFDDLKGEIRLPAAIPTSLSGAPSEVTLKKRFEPFFRVGTAVSPFQLRDPAQAEHIAQHFSSLTAENCMKPDSLYRADGNCNFQQADLLVEFAQKHGMAVRGHTLVWHSQTPPAFFLDENGNQLEKKALYERLERYMTAVLTHFQGKIMCWDVVNEAIADGGQELYRTRSPWYEICGKEYIAEAFRLAHKIAPTVKLYYNDYGLINPEKRARTVQMLRELLDAGVPIDGVGIQAHWNMQTFNPQELQNSIDAFSALGLDVQITELDMSVRSFRPEPDSENRTFLTPEMEEKQAVKYAQAFEVLRRNADKISSVTFWGTSDRFTWLSHFPHGNRKDFPLLFDENSRPKRAFYRVTQE